MTGYFVLPGVLRLEVTWDIQNLSQLSLAQFAHDCGKEYNFSLQGEELSLFCQPFLRCLYREIDLSALFSFPVFLSFFRPTLLREQHYQYLKKGLRHLSDAYEVWYHTFQQAKRTKRNICYGHVHVLWMTHGTESPPPQGLCFYQSSTRGYISSTVSVTTCADLADTNTRSLWIGA